MACYHLHVEQIKRSEGLSSVAAAAYRSGQKLYDDYYGEEQDYTRKRGVILSEIHLPPHAPERFHDREVLWNEVEQTEKHVRAQLAHSYDIALMNEFTLEENLSIVRRFVEEQFVSRGMIVDLAVHEPEKDGIPNPHIHILIPIRPLNQDGSWGTKEKKIQVTDENGDPVFLPNGKPKLTAVSTTGWSSKETLLEIRKAWADINNELFERKGMPERIDWRSYEELGIGKIPTIHEGSAVRQMEARGIETGVHKLNELIMAANEILDIVGNMITWLKNRLRILTEAMEKVPEPTLAAFLQKYYDERNQKAETFAYGTRKAQISNLKEHASVFNYLTENRIYTPSELKERIESVSSEFDALKAKIQKLRKEMNECQKLLNFSNKFQELEPLQREYEKKIFGKKKFYEEHEQELRHYHALKRTLEQYRDENGKLPIAAWEKKLSTAKTQIKLLEEEKKALLPDLSMLQKVQAMVDEVLPPEVSDASPEPQSVSKKTSSKQSIHKNLAQKKEEAISSSKKKTKKLEKESL